MKLTAVQGRKDDEGGSNNKHGQTRNHERPTARPPAHNIPRPATQLSTSYRDETQDRERPHLLAPVDLQVVEACGVTFVDSMIERVIEERCGGDFHQAAAVRESVLAVLGADLARVRPGSEQARQVKEVLTAKGMWSQYLEVGLGADPEVFTKAPVLSSVRFGARIGIPTFSSWNNPEPELVLLVDSRGRVRGATVGNDVNLRDVEGRRALLLGMAPRTTTRPVPSARSSASSTTGSGWSRCGARTSR